jgi:hypothetical protein
MWAAAAVPALLSIAFEGSRYVEPTSTPAWDGDKRESIAEVEPSTSR